MGLLLGVVLKGSAKRGQLEPFLRIKVRIKTVSLWTGRLLRRRHCKKKKKKMQAERGDASTGQQLRADPVFGLEMGVGFPDLSCHWLIFYSVDMFSYC